MAQAHVKHHDYHLVDPSPWPIIGAVGAFLLAVGAISYMHGSPLWYILPGALIVAYTMFGWWRDIVREAHAGDHTRVVQLHLRYGMILFIFSEVMFFVGWFWAYFDAALYANEIQQTSRLAVTDGQWPPAGTQTFDPWDLPLLNTVVLLLSGTTVTWAHHSLIENNRRGLVWGLVLTVALGLLFTTLQAYEYAHAAFGFNRDGDYGGNIYGSTFFMATGFHGAHVIIGTVFLFVCLVRAMRGHFTPEQHFGFEAAAWYWHFVDVVWLFLFCAIYIWGAGVPAAH